MNPQKEETLRKFDDKFTDNGGGFRNVWIYRDGGQKVISEFKSFLSTALDKSYQAGRESVVLELNKWTENVLKETDIQINFGETLLKRLPTLIEQK